MRYLLLSLFLLNTFLGTAFAAEEEMAVDGDTVAANPHLDVSQDLDTLIAHAGEIKEANLYRLREQQLPK